MGSIVYLDTMRRRKSKRRPDPARTADHPYFDGAALADDLDNQIRWLWLTLHAFRRAESEHRPHPTQSPIQQKRRQPADPWWVGHRTSSKDIRRMLMLCLELRRAALACAEPKRDRRVS